MNSELVFGIDGQGKKIQSRIWFFSLVVEENDIPYILERLKDCSAVNVFTILHDKDKIKLDDGSYVLKRFHYHFALRFDNPTTLLAVANIFDLPPRSFNLIQKAKNWRASCRYMLHLDQKEKFLYDIKEIQVLKGTKDDYFNVAIGKSQVVTSDIDLFPDFGNFDKVNYKQQYLDIYDNVSDTKRRNLLLKELKISFDNYLDKRKYEMSTKNVKVIFIEGLTGSGKTTFAKNLAVNSGKSYCISSSSNDILQDYTYEDFLILDDFRDTSFDFVDLLKLLDNFTISSVKSRYKNKVFLGEYIVITSSVPLSDWYSAISEDRNQLFRRINLFAKCEKKDNFLFANIFVPSQNLSAIDNKGFPNGFCYSVPILSFSDFNCVSSELNWQKLGINVDLSKYKHINNAQLKMVDFDLFGD